MILKIILGFLLTVTSLLKSDHAIYISVVDITYSSSGEAEVLIKVFEDDFEIALQNYVDADTVQTPSLHDPQLIQSYFDSHMVIAVNGTTLQTSYLDQEKLNDSIWLHFTMQGPSTCESMELEMSHFMEIYPDQSNIITVTYEDARQYLHLKKRSKTGTLSF